MGEQIAVQKLLLEGLDERKLKNPAYSLRAFARAMGLSPSTLSEVMKGKRRVSRDVAEKIAERLGLNPQQSRKLLSQFSGRRKVRKKIAIRPTEYVSLDMDSYYLISDWYYFAILSLSETADFQSEPEWVAARLGLAKKTAATALSRLQKLGLLEVDNNGALKATGKSFTTSNDIASQAIRKSHAQTLDMAKESLVSDPLTLRKFDAVTMAIDPALLPEAFQRVQTFRDELCSFLESGSKKEVFKLSMQLFPLTEIKENL